VEARLFYDGRCALCHGAVRFVVRHDRGQPPVRFSPIGGESFERVLAAGDLSELPDSLLVLTPDGELLVRSAAALYLLLRAGGIWRLSARLARVLPRVLRDALYDAVARRRRRWFGRTDEVCPVLPSRLRDRFDP
jgi:predicted DCC family thiol-disulfide oxidoreductase YuxK